MPGSPPLPADTIAAVATPPGRGAVAMLRLSGPDAGRILARLSGTAAAPPPRLQRLSAIRHPESGELLDRALVTLFPAPHSFTGEDVVEIATHGGVLTPQLVLDAVLAAGARAALPGEFTRRAFLNGKLDLLQAEAIADLVDGRSRALHRAAVHALERGLSHRVEALREAVLATEALVAYSIDFPEEDEPPVPSERIRASAADVAARIEALLATAPEGELLREGALVVLAGRPNAGKSSLFNALLGTERAIVTEVPGTTRDALEALASIDGYPFRLVDTAGLRETEDPVEGLGIEVARRYLAAADLVVFCAVSGRPLTDDERAFTASVALERLVVVRTMADLHPSRAGGGEVHLSAATGAGVPELRRELLRRVFGGIVGEPEEAPLVTRARQARAFRAALAEVRGFVDALDDAVPMEFAVTHLHAAVGALEELVGVVGVEDVLERVFGSFCVGK